MSVFRRWFGGTPAPLTGAPRVQRQKTYSAGSGYVYQYYYLGRREYRRSGDHGTEYVFEVSADRSRFHPVSVLVSERALAAWEAGHGRALVSAERYAIAKLALLQAFDDRAQPGLMRAGVCVRAAGVAGILENLGID